MLDRIELGDEMAYGGSTCNSNRNVLLIGGDPHPQFGVFAMLEYPAGIL